MLEYVLALLECSLSGEGEGLFATGAEQKKAALRRQLPETIKEGAMEEAARLEVLPELRSSPPLLLRHPLPASL